MRLITFEDVPHTHEIVIDEREMAIMFYLRPDLDEFITQKLGGINRRKDFNEKEYGLCKFILPTYKFWGYGEIFERCGSRPGSDWEVLRCKLPNKPERHILFDLVASMDDLGMAISLFDPAEERVMAKQLMMLECLTVKSHTGFDGGSFSFAYAKDVLDFAESIWSEECDYSAVKAIEDCMKKVYTSLSGKDLTSQEAREFYVNPNQGHQRLPTFNCPGDRTCAIPECSNADKDRGVRYSTHNVDTKIQQLALLTGAIKLANMARS